jgi:hypothetical protein
MNEKEQQSAGEIASRVGRPSLLEKIEPGRLPAELGEGRR